MGQELIIPDSFKNFVPVEAFASLNVHEDNLSDGIGQSYPVIGYKGKVWSIRHRGERKNILDPASGTPAGYLDVIMLGQAKVKAKSYYKKFDPNNSDGDRPICSSIDGLVPDLDVTAKQCDTCAICPRNVWKPDPQTGRKGRECTDYKRVAVLILPTQTKPIFGEPLLEPCFLRVPPDSLNSLAIMGDTMAAQGFHYSVYITRITFDPNKAHPCMVFRPLQGLTAQEAPVVLQMRADPTVARITGGDLAMKTIDHQQGNGGVTSGLTATAQPTVAPVQPAPQPQPVQQVAQPQTQPLSSGLGQSVGQSQATHATTASGLGGTVAAQPATPTQQTASASSTQPGSAGQTIDTGFGSVNTASTAQTQSQPQPVSTQTAGVAGAPVGDAGMPEEADSDLDAKIAALISKS